jgi:hypothetical protein
MKGKNVERMRVGIVRFALFAGQQEVLGPVRVGQAERFRQVEILTLQYLWLRCLTGLVRY